MSGRANFRVTVLAEDLLLAIGALGGQAEGEDSEPLAQACYRLQAAYSVGKAQSAPAVSGTPDTKEDGQ